MENVELYDLGAYPGMILGRGTVVGEWTTVSPEALIMLDKVEGYHSSLAAKDYSCLCRSVEVRQFAEAWVQDEADVCSLMAALVQSTSVTLFRHPMPAAVLQHVSSFCVN